MCPLCRCPEVRQSNAFAERVWKMAVNGIALDCSNKALGCTTSAEVTSLAAHESRCDFREVNCPAHHRGDAPCAWRGPLTQLMTHLATAKCVNVVESDLLDDVPFVMFVGDVNASVFDRAFTAHWRPTMFLNTRFRRHYVCMIFVRGGDGRWIFHLRSFSSEDENVTATVTFYKSPGPNGDPGPGNSVPQFRFVCKVAPQDISNQEVITRGHFICLFDEQLKLLRHERTLFAWQVIIRDKDSE